MNAAEVFRRTGLVANTPDIVLTAGWFKIVGRTQTVGGTSVRVMQRDNAGNVLFATGTTVPAAAGAGWAKGAIFIKTDAAAGESGTYTNVGTTTSANFARIDSVHNVGTAATGSTAVERGNAYHHLTILTVDTTLPAIAGGANLAVGKLLYTFPAGRIIISNTYMSMGITQTEGNINADTPDGGIGTVIASGAVATLGGTATFEDLLTGQTFANCTGTAAVASLTPTTGEPKAIESAGAHTVHFNVADGWAASGDAAALLAGTVILDWTFCG